MISIQLLGEPAIERDGSAVAGPRGHKAWGLLSYLVVGEGARREHLAELLFAEANDPLGALRWNLSQLRRALGADLLPPGSTALTPQADTVIDVEVLTRASTRDALALSGLGRELLAGMDFSSSPAFDGWLLMERRRLIGAAEAVLHEAALDLLAAGEPARAIALARRLVELDPYSEDFQELLIRSYAQAGEPEAAQRSLDACTELFRRELGRDPGPAVARAAGERRIEPGRPDLGSVSREGTLRALLEAGSAAAGAGAVEVALESLRRAGNEARDAGLAELEAEALLALGTTLTHAVRGRDEEASTSLLQAANLADELGLRSVRASAMRELGYIDVLAGRYARCERRLVEAGELATDGSERAAVASVLGMALSDRGSHGPALECFDESVALAEAAGDRKRAAFSHSFAGRSHLVRGEVDQARRRLDQAMALVEEEHWLAFISWPEAMLGELELRQGDVGRARELLEHAFALSCELRDPCWQGISGRGLGALAAAEGNVPEALRRLEDAHDRSTQSPDSYAWVQLYALDALAEVAVASGSRRAGTWVEQLRTQAARTGIREFAAKALGYKAGLGEPGAAAAARAIAAETDNEALKAWLEAPTGPSLTPAG